MIAQRIVRDGALRSLPIWALAALVNTSVLMGLLLWTQRAAGSVPNLILILVGWSGIAVYLAFGQVRTRSNGFDLSLPIPTRELWLAHVMAIIIGAAVVGTLSLLALAAHRLTLGAQIVMGPSIPALAFLLGAGVVLGTLLLQAPSPSLVRIPVTRGYVLWTLIVLVGIPMLLTAASLAGPAGTAALLVLVAAVGLGVYRFVPPAFVVAPLEPAPAGRASRTDPARAPRGFALPLAVLGSVSCGAKEIAAYVFVLLFAIVLGGGLLLESEPDLRFLYIPMAIYMLFAMIGPRLGRLHYLDPLPIRRRTLLAVLLVPYAAITCLGYGLGVLASSEARSRIEYVNYQKSDDGFYVTAPLRVYRVAWGGNPPPVSAPWGESQAPLVQHPWSSSRLAFYSPFAAPPGSSARFVSLQISRAVEASYGVSIPVEEIRERYFAPTEDGSAVPVGEQLTLRADYPELRVRSGPMFPVLLTLTGVPWLLLVAGLLRAYRAGIKEWMRQTVVWGGLALLLGLFLVFFVSNITGFTESWAVRALVQIPTLGLGASTAGTLAVWVAAVLSLSAAYGIAWSQFRRMEIPAKPSKYTLIERMRDE